MAHSVEIPQDIIDNVIAALGNDKRSLKQCALVSSSFLLPSRKQLFYSIRFGFNDEGCQRLHQFLVQNPVIRSFVRRLHVYRGWRSKLTFDKSLPAFLQLSFCHLEEFFFSSLDAVNWSDFSGELKDALSTLMHSPSLKILSVHTIHNVPITLFLGIAHLTKLHLRSVSLKDALSPLIHSPTLKILSLENIDNVPITLFLGTVHLTELHLSSVSLNYSDGEQPSSLASKGVATTTSHTVIDQCVWSFGWRAHGRRFPKYAYFISH